MEIGVGKRCGMTAFNDRTKLGGLGDRRCVRGLSALPARRRMADADGDAALPFCLRAAEMREQMNG